MFDQFPKVRPELPPAYRALYERQYEENRNGKTAAASATQRLERWLHRKVAADTAPNKATLELGAGTLNQLPFEAENSAYDIVEPMAFLYETSPLRSRVRNTYSSIHEVPNTVRYDRIISCAVLEHVCDLPDVIRKSAQLLAPGGSFRASIPAHGGFLWKLGWQMTTGLEFRMRHKLDYGVIMDHEHVNTAREVEEVVRHFFWDVKVKSFGVGRHLSLYRFIEASGQRAA